MCGICGFTGDKDPKVLKSMLDCIAHRGPNDRGSFIDEKVTLGMVRLSIIDLSGGKQPISNEDGTVFVVFNGEIYNYIELRKELEAKGHRFSSASDTETIVHGYEEYGLSLPHRLNGMFAIAIWDKRAQSLILIRDRFGVKPLFYSERSGTLVFASEIKALLYHKSVKRDIDNEALSHYFSLRNIPAPFTVYKDIRAMLPGHMMVWRREKGIEMSAWYKIQMSKRYGDGDENRLVELIDETLNDSVKIRLRSDVEYGAYLSGGIDSSAIVGIMSRYSQKPVKTFTLSYKDAPSHKVDSHYARLIADRYSTEHYEYEMDWTELSKEFESIVRHLDQPFAGVISSYWLSRFMSKHVKVALSGDGADDMFASYGHHRLVNPIAAVRRAISDKKEPSDSDFAFFRDRKEFVKSLAGYYPWEWRLAYAAFMENEKRELFSGKGRELFAQYSSSDFLKDIYNKTSPETDDLNRMLYLDINTLLPNEILYFNDMLSMAHSMEVRTPFLDYRIAEIAFSIPGSLKIKDMTLKYILTKVASRYVPEEILRRPKEGFVLPKNTWLRQGMLPVLKETLSGERTALHGYFNQNYIDGLVKRFVSGDDSLTFRIWTLVIFQVWYEDYIKTIRGS